MSWTRHGSSPHAWGTLRCRPRPQRQLRFIPTCVGNSSGCGLSGDTNTVHPHMRGELGYGPFNSFYAAGSSTHTWGTRAPPAVHPRRGRFIPTYVGNSRSDPELRRRPAVHPHIRGELLPSCSSTTSLSGSSPHTWGTHGPGSLDLDGCRFIPTYVGNSSISSSPSTTATVHPHIRGELSSSAE